MIPFRNLLKYRLRGIVERFLFLSLGDKEKYVTGFVYNKTIFACVFSRELSLLNILYCLKFNKNFYDK